MSFEKEMVRLLETAAANDSARIERLLKAEEEISLKRTRESPASKAESQSKRAAMDDTAPGASGRAAESTWSCAACTLVNAANANECSVCAHPRPQGAGSSRPVVAAPAPAPSPPPAPVPPAAGQRWNCAVCTIENLSDGGACYMCGNARGPGIDGRRRSAV